MGEDQFLSDITEELAIGENGNGTETTILDDEKPPVGGFVDENPEKKPVPVRGRTSASGFISMLWTGLGTALVQSGLDVPVGRVLQFQAPAVGVQLDKLVAGTAVDHFIQPFVLQVDKVEGLGALVMFPLLVGAYERNPDLGPMLAPLLRGVIESNLAEMAPVLKQTVQQTRKNAKAVAEVVEFLNLPPGVDPVDAILESIFADPTLQEPPGDEE